MPELSNFTGKFRVTKNSSTDSTLKANKRPRSTLVCNPCRKSKLRCDKAQPCGTCVKRNEAAGCAYTQQPGSRAVVVEDKLLHLESMVKYLMQNQTSEPLGIGAPTPNSTVPPETPAMLTDATDSPSYQPTNGEYHGSTHWSAILDDIHELKTVIGDTSYTIGDQQNGTPETILPGQESIFGLSNDYSLDLIIAQCLPPRLEVDRLFSLYFRGETFVLPFIHASHFQRQYREFWNNSMKVNPLWLSILFSICYIASLIRDMTISNHSSGDEKAKERSKFHVAAAQCLVMGEYHRPQQFTVEALIMYAQCKNIRSLDPSREAGTILGMAVRLAYEMGYHRDPDSFGAFSPFEGEMRRRFWAVCKQMSLMVSFMLGLPSNICLDNCDTKSPRNLLDSDFDTDTEILPPSRSDIEPTQLLWFMVKDRQMMSFGKVCQDALSFREKSEAEIFELDREVRQMHKTIPEVLRARPLSESIADAPFLIMTRLFVDFIHLKSLCVLHRRYMARGSDFSTRASIEAGTKLVGSFLDMYKELAPGGQLHTERWMLGSFTMNDFLLGVMVLCLVVHTGRKRGSSNSAIDVNTERDVLTLLEQSYTVCVEKAEGSRDAKRVSHAIRLTLKCAKSLPAVEVATQLPLQPPGTFSDKLPSSGEVPVFDPMSTSLQAPLGHSQNEEAAFGLLDPFNFMGNDIENIDWTGFYSQHLG